MANGTPGTLDKVLAGMADLAAQPVMVTDAGSRGKSGPRIRHANALFLDQTGYRRADLVGKAPPVLAATAGRAEGRRLSEALRRGRPARLVLSCPRKEGGTVRMRVRLDPVADARGRVTHWVWVHEPAGAAGQARRRGRKRTPKAVGLDHDLAPRLMEFFDRVSVAFCVYDAGERLVLCNGSYADIVGADAEHLKPGLSYEEQLRRVAYRGRMADIKGNEEEWIAARLRDHRDAPSTFEQKLDDGRWVRVSKFRTHDGGVITICTDITELKRREAALREAESIARDNEGRFKDFAEAASDWLWEMDEKLRFSFFSGRMREITGIEPRMILGKTREEFVGPDSKEEKWKKHFADLAARRQFRDFRYSVVNPEGRRVHWKISGKPVFDGNGTFRGYRGTGTDETAEVEARARAARAEALLMQAIESVSEGFVLYDAEDRLVLCNSKHKEMYWAAAPFMVPGAKFEEMLKVGLSRGQYADAVGCETQWFEERVRAHRNPAGPIEQKLANGRWLLLREHRLPDGSTLGIRTDITELKRKEEALTQRIAELEALHERLEEQGRRLASLAESLTLARDEAERASRTKSEFLANISHELRSPLNAIIGFAEIMKDELFGPMGLSQYAEYAYDIHSSGVHLLDLINDILDLSKIEAGRLELNEQAVDVHEIVDECMRLVRTRADKAEVCLKSELAGDLPLLYSDERKLAQIVLNLLSNAVKFTQAGGTVTISAGVNRRDEFVLTVADTGIGISPEDIPTALAAFGQVDSSISRKYEGTGLGLPLTRALMELHGGRLDLHSSPGIGTTVRVYFPQDRVVQKTQLAAGA